MTASTWLRKVISGCAAVVLVALVALIAILQPAGAPAAQAAAGKKMSGYELEQVTSFNGKYRVMACANAVRLDQLTYGYSFFSCAPNWDVFVFRLDTKEYSQVPYKDWLRANLIMVTTVWTQELKTPVSVHHFEQGGLGYIAYTFPNTSSDSGFLSSAAGADDKDMRNNVGEIVCLDFPADIHAGGVIGRELALPELRGISLQATRKSAKARGWILKTVKVKHSDDISSDLFVLPKGLKKVTFNRSIFSSANTKRRINRRYVWFTGKIGCLPGTGGFQPAH